MPSSPKKRFIYLLIALALGSLAGELFLQYEQKDKKVQTATVIVTRGDLKETVSASGTLEPKDYVNVGAQVSGQLKKLHVAIGDTVKKGDLIAEIDPQTYEAKIAADTASLNALKAQLMQKQAEEELAKAQLDRTQKMNKIKAASQDDLDTKTSAYKVTVATVKSLEAQIQESEANLETDKINLGYTKIYSPMDGIVADQSAREGQTLNANQTTPTIVQVANLDVMTAKAQVAEADVLRLRAGMSVSFAPLGSTDRKWQAEIRQILPTPETVNDVVLYDALIDSQNEDHLLMDGMSVQVTFDVAHADNVLIVAQKALGTRLEDQDTERGKAYRVRVKSKDGPTFSTVVHIGMTTRGKVEVRDGLKEGDEVLVWNTDAEQEESAATKKKGMPPGPGLHL